MICIVLINLDMYAVNASGGDKMITIFNSSKVALTYIADMVKSSESTHFINEIMNAQCHAVETGFVYYKFTI